VRLASKLRVPEDESVWIPASLPLRRSSARTRFTRLPCDMCTAWAQLAVDAAAGTFDTMRTLAPPSARGWEVVAGDEVWNWSEELAQLPSLLAEKVKAPSVTPGPTDLVIDPSNLWLTIHESIGHATEYDRAIGYEAAYAGTSFATPDKLGTMRYGSPVMTVTVDRTVEYGLATVCFDDEGVRAQSWDLVRDGVFVGYQLDRVFAPRLGVARSNGCSYADSPHHVPIQRMANVSLQPAAADVSTVDLIAKLTDGIFIVGDKSWCTRDAPCVAPSGSCVGGSFFVFEGEDIADAIMAEYFLIRKPERAREAT
jgi:TldD protein